MIKAQNVCGGGAIKTSKNTHTRTQSHTRKSQSKYEATHPVYMTESQWT